MGSSPPSLSVGSLGRFVLLLTLLAPLLINGTDAQKTTQLASNKCLWFQSSTLDAQLKILLTGQSSICQCSDAKTSIGWAYDSDPENANHPSVPSKMQILPSEEQNHGV